MILSRRAFAALLSSGRLLAQTSSKLPDNVALIVKAMSDELERSKQLRMVGKDPLYYLEYTLDDAESFSVSASLGGLLHERRNRFRLPKVAARVGAPDFDNTNYLLSGAYFGVRYDPENFPLDDDYDALRQAFWLATDRAYKTALEAIGRKRAALRNVTQSDKLADFASSAEPTRYTGTLTRTKFNEADWRVRTVSLSGIFANFPEVQESIIDFESVQSTSYYLNNEGTVVIMPDLLAYLRIRAGAQAPDGMRVRDHAIVQALDIKQLPTETDLRRIVTTVAANVKSLAAAPVGETYSGPVAFEGDAAAQLFAELFSSSLPASRRPVPEPGRPFNWTPGVFEGRVGSRILPSSFTVVDDPAQKDWRGRPLLGQYVVDLEGTPGKALTVVENGILKTLLSTRTPSKDTTSSNGRARIPGAFGSKTAGISNLFVKCAEPVSSKDLRTQLLKMAADRSKPYAMIIRKMDFPSTASIAELRRTTAGQEHPTSIPLLAYRVYPDGREELVRGLHFRGLSARSLKDIAAATDEEHRFDFLGNAAPFSLVGGSSYVYTSTVVAPSILFEDIELERVEQDLPKLPVVPPPALVPTK